MSLHKNEYGCLMLKLNFPKWDTIINSIKPNHVWSELPGYGLELEPHVTILYGFKDIVKPEYIKDCVYCIKNPIELYIYEISSFNNNDKFDVLKFSVNSNKLNLLHNIFCRFPNVQTHDNYNPHITIGYLKKGMANKYCKKLNKKVKLQSNTYMFSESSGKKYVWDNNKQISVKRDDISYYVPFRN